MIESSRQTKIAPSFDRLTNVSDSSTLKSRSINKQEKWMQFSSINQDLLKKFIENRSIIEKKLATQQPVVYYCRVCRYKATNFFLRIKNN